MPSSSSPATPHSALRNARLLAERERLATMDGLTGLANRREFDQVLAREVKPGRSGPTSRSAWWCSTWTTSRRINDTRGHLRRRRGAQRAIAEVLAGAVREMDVVARYGGEEFAVILPRCDQHDAVRVIERITSTGRATAPISTG